MSIYVRTIPKSIFWKFSNESQFLSCWKPIYKKMAPFTKNNDAYSIKFYLNNYTINVRKIYTAYDLDRKRNRPLQEKTTRKGKYKCRMI